jgi:hypothetical protein
LRSNGIEDAVWALRAALGDQGGLDRRARLFACACIREIKVDGSKTLWDVLSAAGRAAVEAAEGLTADPPLVDVGPYTDSSTQCSALIAANAAYYAFGWEAANCATIRILNVALSVAFERAAEGGQGIGAAVSGARAAVEAALSRIFRVQILGEHDEKDLR